MKKYYRITRNFAVYYNGQLEETTEREQLYRLTDQTMAWGIFDLIGSNSSKEIKKPEEFENNTVYECYNIELIENEQVVKSQSKWFQTEQEGWF